MHFSDRLWRRFIKLHRIVGRIYVARTFVAAPLGAYIHYFEEQMGDLRFFTIAACMDAIVLMFTTGIASVLDLSGVNGLLAITPSGRTYSAIGCGKGWARQL